MAVSGIINRNRQAPAEDTVAFGGVAERFRRAGDADRAIALCREGLRKFPDQLSARVTLGWALLDKGEYDAARQELEQVLRRAPDNLAAIRGLAELHDRPSEMIDGGAAWQREDAAATVEESPSPAPVEDVVLAAEADATAPIVAEIMPAPAAAVEAPRTAAVENPVPAVTRAIAAAAPPAPLVASAGGGTVATLLLKASDPVNLLVAPEPDDWVPARSSDVAHIDLGAFENALNEFEAASDWTGHSVEPSPVVELQLATGVFELSEPAPTIPAPVLLAPSDPEPPVEAVRVLEESVLAVEHPMLAAEEPAFDVEQPVLAAEDPVLIEPQPVLPVERPTPVAREPELAMALPMVVAKERVVEPPVLAAEPPALAVEPPALAVEPPRLVPEEPVFAMKSPVPVAGDSIVEPPVLAAEEPGFAEAQPVSPVEPPLPAARQPVLAVEPPMVVAEEPVLAVEPPMVVAEEPVLAVEPPMLVAEEPVLAAEQPMLAAEQPVLAVVTPSTPVAVGPIVIAPPEPEASAAPEPRALAHVLEIAAPRGLSVVGGRALERQRRLNALERMLRKAQARRLQMTQGSVA